MLDVEACHAKRTLKAGTVGACQWACTGEMGMCRMCVCFFFYQEIKHKTAFHHFLLQIFLMPPCSRCLYVSMQNLFSKKTDVPDRC